MRPLGLLLICSALPSLGCDPKVEVPPDDEIGGDPAPTDDDDATDDDDDADDGDANNGNDAPDEDPPADDDGGTDTDVPTAEGTACADWGTAQACEVEGVAGMQFCDYFEGGMAWGACMTDFECMPGETRAASWCDDPSDEENFECEACGDTEGCTLWGDGTPGWEGCDTPLVLAFDGQQPTLAPAPAAAFDVAGTGQCLTHDWPSADTPWLALDVDGSGAIESGRELFGSGSRLKSGRRAAHGFAALAELDSDDDGKITAADARFHELVLWADHDADKRSRATELSSLAMHGVVAIELGYARNPICDARGNCGIERAAFILADGRTGEVIDLHMPCQ